MSWLENLSKQLGYIITAIGLNVWWVLIGVGILWLIQIVNVVTGYRLNRWGIIPREAWGLPGIIFSPLLHADFAHLFLNTIPLFVLANLVLINGWHIFWSVTLDIVVLGGGLVWLFGRRAIHIGASGLVMGYWGYLLVSAIYHFSVLTIILAALCLYYFASLYINVFPTSKRSSWEGHVFGLIAGVVAVYIT
ncbi:MAG: rhomboid family intramembrane serine protease [Coxiellaceae bacterium]|nr:rhomboid family intramembrane serine protease [Coxiellaceae bacterium]